MATSRDVAAAAAVSQATVSRVLAGSDLVRPETRRRVEEAIRRVGYVPHVSARAMKTGRTGTIGVVVADLTNPFYPHLLEALTTEFERRRVATTIWLSADRGGEAALRAIRERSVDGVVFTTVTASSVELAGALERDRPVVLVNRTVDFLECDQVSSDNVRGGRTVADHFIAGRRRRLGFLGGPPAASTSRDRLIGFRARLAEVEAPPPAVVVGEFSYSDGYAGAIRLLTEHNVDAIFCANDLLAVAARDASAKLNRTVPADLWIAGYDDIPMARWGNPALTTLRQDVELYARETARLLTSRIDDPTLPARHMVVEPEFIQRGSTVAPDVGG